jgi:heptosyltransferase-2
MNRIGLARSLRRRAIPRAILFQNAFGAALTAWLAGVPERVGWNRHLRRMLLTLPVDPAPEDLAAHEVFYHLKLVREAGLPAPFSLPLLEPPAPCGTGAGPGADSAAPGPGQGTVTRERPRGFLLALAPGASYGGAKRWPAASFAAAAKLILEGRPGGSAVILGGRGEEAAAASETARLLAGGPPCRNLAGMTDLAECAAVLAGADLALTNDSGLMHLACALGTPAVTPFGPTDPVTTGPLGRRSAVLRAPVPCSPCLRRECHLKERICFAGVTPRMAAEAAERLLERTPAPFPDLGGRGAPAAFACSLPGGKPPAPLAAPPGVTLVFAIPAREAGDPRLEAPALAWDSPGWPDAPRLPFPQSPPGFPEPAASFGRRPVYIVPEAWPGRFFRDLARGLGADPAGSVWLAPDTEPLRAGRRAGGRTALWLGAGRGLPEGLLAGDFLPDICAPDFQRALDWTGQAT